MDIIDKLTEVFKEFPGIGERQAKRFVYFLISRNNGYIENLTNLVSDLKKETAQCKECFRFFILNSSGEKICDICASASKDNSSLMIVEKDSDLESISKSRIYNGKYFVLGGLVPIVEKNTKSRIRVDALKEKIVDQSKLSSGENKNNIKEIILAFSLSPQGNYTDSFMREQLKDITENLNIKISSLGRGLSTGTELEYLDNDTIKNALKNRQ